MVSFSSLNEPKISFWKDNAIESKTLNGTIQISFSNEIHCIGYNDGENRYKCEKLNDGSSQCRECKSKDISKVYTRLDFSGYEKLVEEITARYYSVYLAYFGGNLLKCGVTRTERVEKRLREQGADYWVELMHFNDANDAYEMERLLQDHFGLKNAITSDKKMENLGKYNIRAVESMLEKIKNTEPFRDYLLEPLEVRRFEYNIPQIFSISENLNGEIITAKGEFMFYNNSGRAYALNMRKTIGRFFSL